MVIIHMLLNKKFILASNSVSRKRLLKNAGLVFLTKKPLCDEEYIKDQLLKKNINKKNFKRFIATFLFFLILSPVTYFTISITDKTKRTDYPGKEISRLVQNKWDDNFRNEIEIVIGDEWYAGNLSYHLPSRPKWTQNLKNSILKVGVNEGVVYTGNPEILKKVCPGVFGVIRPVGYCMIGQK